MSFVIGGVIGPIFGFSFGFIMHGVLTSNRATTPDKSGGRACLLMPTGC